MKVLTGHLTATEKKVIKAILTAGLTEAGVKNKNYFLTESNGIYTVKIQQKDKGLIPCPGTKTRASIYTHTFSLNPNHKPKTAMKTKKDNFINALIRAGYEEKYKDGDRYMELYKSFQNSDTPVNNSDELQIGRAIEIYNDNVISKPFMKMGYFWASSAEIVSRKGNIYQYGKSRVIAKI